VLSHPPIELCLNHAITILGDPYFLAYQSNIPRAGKERLRSCQKKREKNGELYSVSHMGDVAKGQHL
jgi:hypothetical protein